MTFLIPLQLRFLLGSPFPEMTGLKVDMLFGSEELADSKFLDTRLQKSFELFPTMKAAFSNLPNRDHRQLDLLVRASLEKVRQIESVLGSPSSIV